MRSDLHPIEKGIPDEVILRRETCPSLPHEGAKMTTSRVDGTAMFHKIACVDTMLVEDSILDQNAGSSVAGARVREVSRILTPFVLTRCR